MEQRDIIKDQIEQLGKALGKILASFLGLKSQGNLTSAIEITNQKLQSELDLDFEKLMQLESNNLEEYVESLKLRNNNLEQLSTYYFEIGISKKNEDGKEGIRFIKTAKKLLELVESKTTTITFERINLKNKIENELQQNI